MTPDRANEHPAAGISLADGTIVTREQRGARRRQSNVAGEPLKTAEARGFVFRS
jgi:hypothetical protein